MVDLAALRTFSPANRYGLVVGLIAVTYVVSATAHGTASQAAIVASSR